MEESLCELKSKNERRQDIINEIIRLQSEKGALIIAYREKTKAIDNQLDELDHKLMTGKY